MLNSAPEVATAGVENTTAREVAVLGTVKVAVHLVHEPTLAISPVEAVMLETAVGVIEAPEL